MALKGIRSICIRVAILWTGVCTCAHPASANPIDLQALIPDPVNPKHYQSAVMGGFYKVPQKPWDWSTVHGMVPGADAFSLDTTSMQRLALWLGVTDEVKQLMIELAIEGENAYLQKWTRAVAAVDAAWAANIRGSHALTDESRAIAEDAHKALDDLLTFGALQQRILVESIQLMLDDEQIAALNALRTRDFMFRLVQDDANTKLERVDVHAVVAGVGTAYAERSDVQAIMRDYRSIITPLVRTRTDSAVQAHTYSLDSSDRRTLGITAYNTSVRIAAIHADVLSRLRELCDPTERDAFKAALALELGIGVTTSTPVVDTYAYQYLEMVEDLTSPSAPLLTVEQREAITEITDHLRHELVQILQSDLPRITAQSSASEHVDAQAPFGKVTLYRSQDAPEAVFNWGHDSAWEDRIAPKVERLERNAVMQLRSILTIKQRAALLRQRAY